MSFKNQQNWNGFNESLLTNQVSVTVYVDVKDTYITNTQENELGFQVFDNKKQDFISIQESTDPISNIPIDDGSVISELTVGDGIGTSPGRNRPSVPGSADCQAAKDALFNIEQEQWDEYNRKAKEEWLNYLNCRAAAKQKFADDLRQWYTLCGALHGNPLDPDWNPKDFQRKFLPPAPQGPGRGLNDPCYVSFCAIVEEYVGAVGGDDVCEYAPDPNVDPFQDKFGACKDARCEPGGSCRQKFNSKVGGGFHINWGEPIDPDNPQDNPQPLPDINPDIFPNPIYEKGNDLDYDDAVSPKQCDVGKKCNDIGMMMSYCCRKPMIEAARYCRSLEGPPLESIYKCAERKYQAQVETSNCQAALLEDWCENNSSIFDRGACLSRLAGKNQEDFYSCKDAAKRWYEWKKSTATSPIEQDAIDSEYRERLKQCLNRHPFEGNDEWRRILDVEEA